MKTIGIIGHSGHGKTTVSNRLVVEAKQKTIHEILEEDKTIKITAPKEMPLVDLDFKDGKQKRRERRDKERKSNCKGKFF